MTGRVAVCLAGYCGLWGTVASGAESEAFHSAGQPRVQRAGDRITRVSGAVLATGGSVAEAAEQFRVQQARMFGVAPEDLRPQSLLEDQRHTQPVMPDQQTGGFKFTLVYYSQYKNGVPVFNADLRLLVRNEPGFPVVLASSHLRALGEFLPSAEPTPAENAAAGREKALAFAPTLLTFTEPRRVVWAGVDDLVVQPVVAYTFVGDNKASPQADQRQRWLFVVDAVTGDILHSEDQVLEVDVTGNVAGLTTQGVGADICEQELPEPMAYARANIASTMSFADIDGDFTIPNGGATTVTVQSPVRGQFFRVFNFAAADTVLSQSVVPPGPADFLHNPSNTEFPRGEVNGYIEANITRDTVLAANPNYPVIPSQVEFTVNVNQVGGICPGNAQYTFDAINFCRAGGGYPNTSWSAVVNHEYGHHVVQTGGSGQGAYGEGLADVMSVVINDDPRLGFGFFGNCTSSLRTADNDCQYSQSGCSTCGSEIHVCGQLLSGCVWDTRNELVLTEPDDYLSILRDLAVNSVLLHSGSTIGPDILVDWLTLDDNDANPDNGSPHHDEICVGFGAHGFDCPALSPMAFEYPQGRPQFVVPNEPTVIPVNVVGIADEPVAGSGMLFSRIGTSGAFTGLPMVEITPNHYEAALPAAQCLQTIQYYFQAAAQSAGQLTDPADAPTTSFNSIAAGGTITVLDDTFEIDSGWTVVDGGPTTSGQWERVDPVGTVSSLGQQAAPENDATPDGTMAFVTQNGQVGGIASASDVDGGPTYLLSPVVDLDGADAIISYAHWVYSAFGVHDVLTTQISNDAGSSWVTVGTTADSASSWQSFSFQVGVYVDPTSTVRLRFGISDIPNTSVTEAGIDDLKIEVITCEGAPCPADLDGSGSVDPADLALLLGVWGPNPGHPADLNANGSVGPEDLALLLGAWGDCL